MLLLMHAYYWSRMLLQGKCRACFRVQLLHMLDVSGKGHITPFECVALRSTTVQVAAELGAKSPTSSGDLTPEEEALVATNSVLEGPFDNAEYEGQQLRLQASSDRRHPETTPSSHSKQASGGHSVQDTVQSKVLSGASGSPTHPVPTHSYRHGRVLQKSATNRTAASIDNAAAELQPA